MARGVAVVTAAEEPSPPEPSTAPQAARSSAPGHSIGPRSLGVQADDSLPEAARKVLIFHFIRMRAKEKGTRDGSDVEDLHQMRVSTRRMRAAWRVFDDAFKRAIEQETGTRPVHPMQLMARAYGIPEEQA